MLLRPLLASAARQYLRNATAASTPAADDRKEGIWQACRGHVAALGLLKQLHELLHKGGAAPTEMEDEQWNACAEAAMRRLRTEDADMLQGCERLVNTYIEVNAFVIVSPRFILAVIRCPVPHVCSSYFVSTACATACVHVLHSFVNIIWHCADTLHSKL